MRVGMGMGLPLPGWFSMDAKIAALFAGGQQGARYAPSDFSTLFQDSAGTTPVTAVDQPVGKINDKSGRANHATQATAAARPVVKADGSLLFDGVDDGLSSATGGGSTVGFFWCGAVKVAGGAGTTRALLSDEGSAAGYILRVDATNNFIFFAGDGVGFPSVTDTVPINVGTTYLLTAWDDGANLNVQVDGNTIKSTPRPTVVAGSAGFSLGKSNVAAVNFFNGNFYPFVYRTGTVVTAAERAFIQAYVRSKAGL